MVWCKYCALKVVGSRDDNGFLYCDVCGKVLDSFNFSDEPVFTKNSSGQSQLSGNFIRSVESDVPASRERTLNRAYEDMTYMRNGLNMGDNDELVRVALAFYTIAYERGFTRGRCSEHVQAACLYIACRQKNSPYLLIDFSNYLRINVYVLGAVFLQLCRVLNFHHHPIVQKPVDPSLFIDRFTQCLLGNNHEDGKKKEVSRTALKIITSMKRDWMQTGRKPSGLCGAALYISALSHGLKCSKTEIIRAVHICETTLTKRLIEFENTESGSLTLVEFLAMADKSKESSSAQNTLGSNGVSNASSKGEVLCMHKKDCIEPFALGLCRNCYDEFIELSGGLDGGMDPPAFQHAEKERLAREAADENTNVSSDTESTLQGLRSNKTIAEELNDPLVRKGEGQYSSNPQENGTVDEHSVIDEVSDGNLNGVNDRATDDCDESGNLSEIDDDEVDGYLHNEEEKHYKKIIWEEMNRPYLEEQAAKEAAAEAARKAYEATFENCPDDLLAAQEFAAATAAAMAKSRKERQQKRAAVAKNSSPAQTAAEATRQMLTKKRLSSKINYDVLDKLFDDVPETRKVQRKDEEEILDTAEKDAEKLDAHKIDSHKIGNDEAAYDTNFYANKLEREYDYDNGYGYDEYD